MEFDWTLGLLYLIPIFLTAFLFVRSRKEWSKRRKNQFIIGLSLRLFGCLLFILIYRYHYGGGDTFMYFKNIQSLNQVLYESPTTYFELLFRSQVFDPQNYVGSQFYKYWDITGVWLVVRMGSVFSWLGLNSFFATSLLFACFSFIGMWLFYYALIEKYPKAEKLLFMVIFALPSFIFWSSALMKEALIFGAIGMLYWCLLQINDKTKSISFWVALLCSLYMLIHMKQYVFYVIVFCVSLWAVLEYLMNNKRISLRAGMVVLLIGCAVLFSMFGLEHRFVPNDWLNYAQEFYIYNLENSHGEDKLSASKPNFDLKSQILRSPKILLFALTEPFLWNCRDIYDYLASLESIGIIILMTISLYTSFKKMLVSNRKKKVDVFLHHCWICGLFLIIGIGMATPNIGSLIRYRSVALLFLLIPCVIGLCNNMSKVRI